MEIINLALAPQLAQTAGDGGASGEDGGSQLFMRDGKGQGKLMLGGLGLEWLSKEEKKLDEAILHKFVMFDHLQSLYAGPIFSQFSDNGNGDWRVENLPPITDGDLDGAVGAKLTGSIWDERYLKYASFLQDIQQDMVAILFGFPQGAITGLDYVHLFGFHLDGVMFNPLIVGALTQECLYGFLHAYASAKKS